MMFLNTEEFLQCFPHSLRGWEHSVKEWGNFLLLGLFTRPFAVLIFITMFVAAFFQQASQGVWNMLPAMGIMWLSLFYIILGSGRLGLDYLIAKK